MITGNVLSKITLMENRSSSVHGTVILGYDGSAPSGSTDKTGNQLTDRAVTSLRFEGGKGVTLPVDMHVVHEAAPARQMPDIIRIDCTGLGGHDLGGPLPWHICVRTDRHGQNIYGPSLATIETTVHHPQRRPRHIVALGLTKAMHELVTLHYFATDSAAGWDDLLIRRLPHPYPRLT